MTKTRHGGAVNQGVHDWHPDKPMWLKPTVSNSPELIDGVLYYLGTGKYFGKLYIKEMFDRIFNVRSMKILPRHFKGRYNKTKGEELNQAV